jgi:hypothetical protein
MCGIVGFSGRREASPVTVVRTTHHSHSNETPDQNLDNDRPCRSIRDPDWRDYEERCRTSAQVCGAHFQLLGTRSR